MVKESLEYIFNSLRKYGWKISTIETCTSGEFASKLYIEDIDDIFEDGFIIHNIDKYDIDKTIINEYGVLSKEFTEAIADLFLEKGSDVSIALIGTLNVNNPDDPEKEGICYICAKTKTGIKQEMPVKLCAEQKKNLNRDSIKTIYAVTAISVLKFLFQQIEENKKSEE